MNKAPSTPATPAGTQRLEDLNDRQILDMIKRAPDDVHIARELLHLQKQASERMADAIQKMVAKLGEVCPEQARVSSGPMSVAALASAARQREGAGKQKREFAASLVIGAMVNRNNPEWNIFDGGANPPQDENGFLALLQMKLPVAA